MPKCVGCGNDMRVTASKQYRDLKGGLYRHDTLKCPVCKLIDHDWIVLTEDEAAAAEEKAPGIENELSYPEGVVSTVSLESLDEVGRRLADELRRTGTIKLF